MAWGCSNFAGGRGSGFARLESKYLKDKELVEKYLFWNPSRTEALIRDYLPMDPKIIWSSTVYSFPFQEPSPSFDAENFNRC